MAEQAVSEQDPGVQPAGPTVLERIGEEGLCTAVRKATPLWIRLRGRGRIAERVLREILARAYTIRDVERLYKERSWRSGEHRNRARWRKVVPVLRKMGVPER